MSKRFQLVSLKLTGHIEDQFLGTDINSAFKEAALAIHSRSYDLNLTNDQLGIFESLVESDCYHYALAYCRDLGKLQFEFRAVSLRVEHVCGQAPMVISP